MRLVIQGSSPRLQQRLRILTPVFARDTTKITILAFILNPQQATYAQSTLACNAVRSMYLLTVPCSRFASSSWRHSHKKLHASLTTYVGPETIISTPRLMTTCFESTPPITNAACHNYLLKDFGCGSDLGCG